MHLAASAYSVTVKHTASILLSRVWCRIKMSVFNTLEEDGEELLRKKDHKFDGICMYLQILPSLVSIRELSYHQADCLRLYSIFSRVPLHITRKTPLSQNYTKTNFIIILLIKSHPLSTWRLPIYNFNIKNALKA